MCAIKPEGTQPQAASSNNPEKYTAIYNKVKKRIKQLQAALLYNT